MLNFFKQITKKKLIALIAAGVVAVAAIATVVTISVIRNMPENVAIRAIADTINAVEEREEIKPIMSIVKGGSVEAKLGKIQNSWKSDHGAAGSDEGDYTYFNGSASGKLYFSESALMLDAFKFKKGLLKLNGSAYISSDLIYVEEEEILDGAYGIDLTKKISKLIEDSIFAYESESKYSFSEILDRDSYEKMLDRLDEVLISDSKAEKAFRADLEALIEDLIKDSWDIIVENVTITEKIETIEVGEEDVKARVITITAKPKQMAKIVDRLYDKVLDGQRLKSFVRTHNKTITKLLMLDSMDSEDKDAYDLFKNWVDDLENNVEDICDNIKDNAEKLEIELATPKRKATLLKVTAFYDDDEVFTLDFGKKGLRETDRIAILNGSGDEIFVYSVESEKDGYELTVEVREQKMLDFYYDKENKNYTLAIYEEYLDKDTNTLCEISGTLEINKGVYNITVEKFSRKDTYYSWYKYEDTYTIELSLTVKTSDKIPAAPKTYAGIDEITSKNIEAWLEEINRAFR